VLEHRPVIADFVVARFDADAAKIFEAILKAMQAEQEDGAPS
jgi:hypothetical protein